MDNRKKEKIKPKMNSSEKVIKVDKLLARWTKKKKRED